MKLLILGAGVYQLPAIVRAREMGLETLVLSAPGNYPGIAAASRFLPVDTTDIEACLQVARRERIDGVLSPGTDVAIPTLGAIAEALSLPGPSRAAALRATDKRLMKRAFAAAGVRSPDYREIRSEAEAISAIDTLGCPSILKVADSSGSRGIERIDAPGQVRMAFARCRKVTRTDSLLLERFVEGQEFGAQAFVAAGKLDFVMPHGDVIARTRAASVPVGHYVPLPLSDAVSQDVHVQVERCVRALDVDNCALNVDFIATDDGIHVLEVGARSGATCLAEMVSAHFGFDYYAYMIRCALGLPREQEFRPGAAVAATLLTADTDGTLARVPDLPHDDAIVDCAFDYAPGQPVRRFEVGPDRIGHLVVAGPDLDAARRRLQILAERMSFDIRPAPAHTPT